MNHLLLRQARHLALAGLAAPLAAQATGLDWQLDPNPPSRWAPAFAYDAALDGFVLFGGSTETQVTSPLPDTWLWRGSWQRLDTAQSPPARASASMVYDTGHQRLVMFGGAPTPNGSMADTWLFDGTNWAQVISPLSPPARRNAQMGYDPVRDRVVLRAGGTPFGSFTDLWEFDGTAWQQKVQAGPTPTGASRFVYDEAHQELLSVGATVAAWNGTTWSPRSNVGLPSPFLIQEVTYDPLQQRVLCFSRDDLTSVCQLHAYTGQAWQVVRTITAPTDFFAVAFDLSHQQAVAFRTLPSFSPDLRSHTFTWQDVADPASAWQLVVTGLPPARKGAAMGYDPLRRRLVVDGGFPNTSTIARMHEADQRDWIPRTLGTGPGPDYHGCVWDPVRGALLLVGSGSNTFRIDTWNGFAMTAVANSTLTPPRWENGLAFDTLRNRVVVFGGESFGGMTNELWEFHGGAWTNLTVPGPSPRKNPAFCYDAARDRMVLFGGLAADGVTFLGDTWEFDGTAWTQHTPATTPAPRAAAVLVDATHLGKCVMVGGHGAQDFRETWTWDGTDWSPLTTAHQFDTGDGIAAAYDPDRREIILFGGGTFVGPAPIYYRGEVWRLRDVSLTTWTHSGVGCDAGSGPLQLEALDPPALGTTARIELRNTPALFTALPIGWVGFDDQQWNGLTLPIDLAVLGSPGCSIWADAQVPMPMQPLGNHALGSIVLPDVPAALGFHVYVQGIVWDFATGSIATADLLRGIVGPR